MLTSLYFTHSCTKHTHPFLPSGSEATPPENHLYMNTNVGQTSCQDKTSLIIPMLSPVHKCSPNCAHKSSPSHFYENMLVATVIPHYIWKQTRHRLVQHPAKTKPHFSPANKCPSITSPPFPPKQLLICICGHTHKTYHTDMLPYKTVTKPHSV